jgi:hypothetical protein
MRRRARAERGPTPDRPSESGTYWSAVVIRVRDNKMARVIKLPAPPVHPHNLVHALGSQRTWLTWSGFRDCYPAWRGCQHLCQKSVAEPCRRRERDSRVSRPAEFHHRPLAEPSAGPRQSPKAIPVAPSPTCAARLVPGLRRPICKPIELGTPSEHVGGTFATGQADGLHLCLKTGSIASRSADAGTRTSAISPKPDAARLF